jgi:hypothetical protein
MRYLARILSLALLTLVGLSSFANERFGESVWQWDDWSTGRPLVNLAEMTRPYGSVDSPWDPPLPFAAYTPFNTPAGDFGGFLLLGDYPVTADYTVTVNGQGQATLVSGGTVVSPGVWRISGDLPLTSRGFRYKVTGGNGQFKGLQIRLPGYPADAIFTTEFLSQFTTWSPGGHLRMMDLGRMNTTRPHTWENRSKPGEIQTRPDLGVCWEYQIALANATNKDLWLNLPHWLKPTDVYTQKLVALVTANLKPNLNLYLEFSNEIWNGQFPQQQALLADALANPNLFASDKYERLCEHHAYMLDGFATVFRASLRDRVRPILPGQGVNGWWVERGCNFLDKKYGVGSAKARLYAVAYADYFQPTAAAEGAANATVDTLFDSMDQEITTTSLAMLKAHVAIGNQYGGIPVVTYEAGPGFTGNTPLHLAMLRSDRLGKSVRKAYDQFIANGGRAYTAYASIGGWDDAHGQWWGSKAALSASSSKFDALQAIGGLGGSPPVAQPNTLPVACWFQPVRNVPMLTSIGITHFVGPEVENSGVMSPATLAVAQAQWVKTVADNGGKVIYKLPPPGPLPANVVGLFLSRDEPNGKGILPSALQAEVTDLRTRYPGVPIYISLAGDKITSADFNKPEQLQLYRDYAALADVLTIDVYSINRNSERYATTWTGEAAKKLADATGKPVWAWCEMNDQQLKPVLTTDVNRCPTPAEIQATVDYAIAKGVKGIGWFSTCDGTSGHNYGWPANYWPLVDRNWNSIKPQLDTVASITNKLTGLGSGVFPPFVVPVKPSTQPTTNPTTNPTVPPVVTPDNQTLQDLVKRIDYQNTALQDLKTLTTSLQDTVNTLQDLVKKPKTFVEQ